MNQARYYADSVSKYRGEIEYNTEYTAGMALSQLIIINNDLVNKYIDEVPEQVPLIILDRKPVVCMARNGKYTKQTRKITRRIVFVRNGEKRNIHKTGWCEGGMQLADIGTNHVRDEELNSRSVYSMVRIDN